jgi:hypothetical protein
VLDGAASVTTSFRYWTSQRVLQITQIAKEPVSAGGEVEEANRLSFSGFETGVIRKALPEFGFYVFPFESRRESSSFLLLQLLRTRDLPR